MWRIALIVLSLAAILLGSLQMDLRTWRGSDEGHHASLQAVVADPDCAGDLADDGGPGDRDCCMALHCVPCAAVLEPRVLHASVGPVRESASDFGAAWLSGRIVLPEKAPPKLV